MYFGAITPWDIGGRVARVRMDALVVHNILCFVKGDRARACLRRVDRTWLAAHQLLTAGPRALVLHSTKLSVHDGETLLSMYSIDLEAPTYDGVVAEWDDVRNEQVVRSCTKTCRPARVAVSGNRAFVGYNGRTAFLQALDIASRRQVWLVELPDHSDCRCMDVTGTFVAMGCWDGAVAVCHATDGNVFRTFQAGSHVMCCSFNTDGSKLAAGTIVSTLPQAGEYGVIVWDTASGAKLHRIPASYFITSVNCIAFVHASVGVDHILTGSNDAQLKLWRLDQAVVRRPRATISFKDWVNACAVLPEGHGQGWWIVANGVMRASGTCTSDVMASRLPLEGVNGDDTPFTLPVERWSGPCKVASQGVSFIGPDLLLSGWMGSHSIRSDAINSLIVWRVGDQEPKLVHPLREKAQFAIGWQPSPSFRDQCNV